MIADTMHYWLEHINGFQCVYVCFISVNCDVLRGSVENACAYTLYIYLILKNAHYCHAAQGQQL